MNEDHRLRRLLFRSRRRGMNENDLLLGRFAEARLHALNPEQLDRYEALLDEIDIDLFNWITGREPVPKPFDHDVMKLIRSFNDTDK